MTAPHPFIEADVDLRGLDYMPLFGNHLFGSEFNAAATDSEWRAALTLWWAAWNQVPAGSLPADDTALCRLADLGRDLRSWRKIRERALHGFTLCNDGRLYHEFLCEQAVIAWGKRAKERQRKAEWRAQRASNQGAKPEDVPRRVPDMSPGQSAGRDADVPSNGTVRDGTVLNTQPATAGSSPADAGESADLLGDATPKTPKPPACPHLDVLKVWAEVMPDLAQHIPSQWKGTRADHLRARWRETAVEKGWTTEAEGLAYMRKLFAWCRHSPWLMGKVARREGRAFDFELAWLVNPTNWAKCLEGKYHGQG